jgi:hypothetical protein
MVNKGIFNERERKKTREPCNKEGTNAVAFVRAKGRYLVHIDHTCKSASVKT